MKMGEKEFVEYIPGIISTTGMDRHGHQIPEEELERWAEKIRTEGIPLTLHHDSEKLVGEWVTAEVVSYGEFAALSAIAGVYEGNEDMAEDLHDGEFGGLSITAQDYLNTSEDDWQSVNETLSLTVDGSWSQFVYKLIETENLESRFEIQKSAAGLALFEIAVENIDKIVQSAIMLHAYWKFQPKSQSSEEEDVEPPKIELPNGEKIALTDTTLSEIVEKLVEAGYPVTITPDQAEKMGESVESELDEAVEEDPQ
jgi:hypothetical protein